MQKKNSRTIVFSAAFDFISPNTNIFIYTGSGFSRSLGWTLILNTDVRTMEKTAERNKQNLSRFYNILETTGHNFVRVSPSSVSEPRRKDKTDDSARSSFFICILFVRVHH